MELKLLTYFFIWLSFCAVVVSCEEAQNRNANQKQALCIVENQEDGIAIDTDGKPIVCP